MGSLNVSFTNLPRYSIFLNSPWTKITFLGSRCFIRSKIPVASACALKLIEETFMFTLYILLSILMFFMPCRTLFPSVPFTQYPGIINRLFSSSHQALKACIEVPPCSMPGVASKTMGCADFKRFLSKGLIWLNSKRLL